MKVFVKDLQVDIELKNNGMELGIYTPDGNTFLGDCVVTKSGLEWCKGKTAWGNGEKISWKDFIAYMESR
jgi:hypothetical protein